MSPRFLGISASILAIAFIVALPEAFEGEPADQVDSINFGPPPRVGHEAAERVGATGNRPRRRGSGASADAPAAVMPRKDGVAGKNDRGQVARAEDGDDDARPGASKPDDDDSGGGGQPGGDDTPTPPPPPAPPPVDEDDDGGEADKRLAPGEGEAEVDD